MDLEAFGAQLTAALTASQEQSAAQFTAALTASQEAMVAQFAAQLAAHTPTPVDPTAGIGEDSPYEVVGGRLIQRPGANFAADLLSRDAERQARAMQLVAAQFAVTTPGSKVPGTEWRPDLAVTGQDYARPLTDLLSRGTCDSQPFAFPVVTGGSAAAVAWGAEAAEAAITIATPSVEPALIAGKVVVPRSLLDGASPQASQWLFDRLTSAYRDAVEAHIVSVLVAAAGSISNVTLTAGAVDGALVSALVGALADLSFAPGVVAGDSAIVSQQSLYSRLRAAKDSTGRQLLPFLGAVNAAGQRGSGQLGGLDVEGFPVLPGWALTPSVGNPESSWLVSPRGASAWHSAPSKVDIEGVAVVTVGIYGYAAAVVADASLCREVIYDTTA